MTGSLAGVRAVAVDVDGTIAGSDHRVSGRTAAAIAGVLDAGLPVYLLTGRSRRSVLELARELGIENPVAASNGSVVFDPVEDRDLRTIPLGDDDVATLVALHRDLDLGLTWWTRDDIWVDAPGLLADTLTALNEQDVRVGSIDDVAPGEILKIMLHGTPDELDAAAVEILQRVPQGQRSMDVFFEFVAPHATKSTALDLLLGDAIDPADVLGIGDGGNDVIWLRRIGHPVAMGNARDEVLAVTTRQTGHHAEDGAAEILETLVDHLAAA